MQAAVMAWYFTEILRDVKRVKQKNYGFKNEFEYVEIHGKIKKERKTWL